MVPYTTFLLQAFDAHLKTLAVSSDESSVESSALWTSLIMTLTKTLSYDDGGMYIWIKPRMHVTTLILITNLL